MKPNVAYWLALHHLPIQPRKILRWLEKLSTPENLLLANQEKLLMIGASKEEIFAIQKPNWLAVEKDLAWAEMADHAILSLSDEDYPSLLKQIIHPPLVLYVMGNKKALLRKQLAIVGSRQASPTGIKNAEQFAYQLSLAGLAITSGLALGVDAASHQGAIAAKGETISVFGTGLNHIYPRSNRRLAHEILEHQGVIISEFPLDTPPKAMNFPLRNRIIAGLSVGVLIIEAAHKSGSLITANYALEQGKEIFAIPGSIQNQTSKGCHYLIKQGAKLVECIEDILEELNIFTVEPTLKIATQQTNKQIVKFGTKLTDQEKCLFEQIGYEISPIDVIILRTGLTRSEVSSILLSLELQGYIQTVSGGVIRVT
ncbi:MAG: DNA protecting protein DprA [Gammaproteobacteria bacterium RIFCSPHIGHO2_12_FULL_37_14]|nr:MAG: DNA protecting protein DprA [Gammaproteobacteria bacterium RIFCSPHIGHO2_12_FULL_37_14]